MAYLAVDKSGEEYIYGRKPSRGSDIWYSGAIISHPYIKLPKGSITKLIGRELTWEDEYYELK